MKKEKVEKIYKELYKEVYKGFDHDNHDNKGNTEVELVSWGLTEFALALGLKFPDIVKIELEVEKRGDLQGEEDSWLG